MKTISIFLMIILSFVSCSTKKPEKEAVTYKKTVPSITTTKPKQLSMTSRMLASEQGTDLVTEINFQKGSANLSESSQKKLRKLFEKGQAKGEISEVQIVSWADREYPSKEKEELDSKQKALAKKRNEAIRTYLQGIEKDLKFTLVSMAERISTVSKVTFSDKAEIKESLQAAENANMISKSLVMMK